MEQLKNKNEIIHQLQKEIFLLQGFKSVETTKAGGIGLGNIESAFPNNVFPVAAVHEFLSTEPESAAASAGFIAGILKSLMSDGGICLWIGASRKLFPPSLLAFNISPERMIFIDVKEEKQVLWVMEQALKCGGLAAVIAEVKEISIIQSRRLQLAVEASKVTGFLIRNSHGKLNSNVCAARWKVSSIPSLLADGLPGVGFPRWSVELLKVRNGNSGSWQMEWIDGAFKDIDDNIEVSELQFHIGGQYA